MTAKKTAAKKTAAAPPPKESGVAGTFPIPDDEYFTVPVTTRRGHSGDNIDDMGAILAIQQELGIPGTGIFDAATGDAVRAWREANGLVPATFVDRETWDKMAGA